MMTRMLNALPGLPDQTFEKRKKKKKVMFFLHQTHIYSKHTF